MLLEQCNAFPQALLPLYIFEARYRTMLRHALETDRLLCIGHLAPSDDPDAMESDDRIAEYSTACIIRACVGNKDGTSHLVLQGAQRIRFLSWDQYEPFRIARIEPVPTHCANPSSAGGKGKILLDRVLGMIQKGTPNALQLGTQLRNLADPAHLTDFVAGNLIHNATDRQPLLGMSEVEDRLDFLLNLIPGPGIKPANS